MDWEIEKRENKSVKEIFSQQGEDYFRNLEAEVLRHWVALPDSFVMGTGGGAPCFYSGIEIINQYGLSVFLDVPVDVLSMRLANATDRPLLNTENKEDRESRLHSLRDARLPIYKQAHITIEDAILENVLKAIWLKGKS